MKQFEPTAGEEELEGGKSDVTQDAGDTMPDEAKPIEGGESDIDGGAEAGKAGEDADAEAGTTDEKEGESGVTPEHLTAIKDEILKELKGGDADAPEDVLQKFALPEMNKKVVGGLAEKFGVTEENLPGFQAAMPAVGALLNLVIGNLVKHYEGKFAGFEYERSLESLSKQKDFADIPALRKGIDEFLGDFAPVHRANPRLIQKAVIYARGLNAKAQVKAAAAGADRNTKIIAKTKPSGASGGFGASKQIKLSATQESAAAMYPGGRAAYIKHLQGRNGAKTLEPVAR